MSAEADRIMSELAEPFEVSEVKFKPAVVNGNRAMALHYVDARVVMDRLDDVLGVAGWQDEYEMMPDGSALCRLRLRIEGEWITKMDVGGESDQKDEGDRHKSAISDALKRAAVKFGIGRYLYRIASAWFDYDPQKKQFVTKPTLPANCYPKKQATAPAAKQPPASKPANGHDKAKPPTTPGELKKRIDDADAAGSDRGYFAPGQLYAYVMRATCEAPLVPPAPEDMGGWTPPQIAFAYAAGLEYLREKKEEHAAHQKARQNANAVPEDDAA